MADRDQGMDPSTDVMPSGGAPVSQTAPPRGPGLGAQVWRWFTRAQIRLVALMVLGGLVALKVWDPVPLQYLRIKTFDLFQQLRPRVIEERPVVIVDIDEASLAELGQFPWPRTVFADLVNELTRLGAAVVAFDVVFPETDRMSPSAVAAVFPELEDDARELLEALPSNDALFAEAIRNGRVVLGQAMTPKLTPRTDVAGATPGSFAFKGVRPDDFVRPNRGLVRNNDIIDQAPPAGRGVFTVAPELDGVVRRVPMLNRVGDHYFPALSLETLRVALGNSTILVESDALAGISKMVMRIPGSRDRLEIKTNYQGNVFVYFSKHDKEKYIPAADVINGLVGEDQIAGRLVLIGPSAVGLLDIKSTPLDPFVPGVEVHANILENVLTGTQLQRPPEGVGVEVTAFLVAGLLMITLAPMLGAKWSLVLFFALAGAMGGATWYAFLEHRLLFDPVYPGISVLVLYLYLTYAAYANEEAQRRQVRDAFSRYMSPALVERLAADPTRLKLGGEMRDMTMMFCDVRGFTSISELFDAQGLTQLINKFLTPMTHVIMERQGTIDKYMGDCIMAFWNAPLDDAEHAKNACNSALAMQQQLGALNDRLKEEAEETGRKHIPLNIGIGLNSDVVCVGNMGSDQRFDYSVLGDGVNLASRLEGQSKTYGVTTVAGEHTRIKAPDHAMLELDRIQVKGKTEPVTIFGLLGDPDMAVHEAFKTLEAAHNTMLAAYRGQDWDAAETAMTQARRTAQGMGLHIDGLYDLYEVRFADYRANPPGIAWDGVYVATSK